MSESIDRRVVEMRFDNKDFEQNVNTTMTVLDKLKEKLSFKGAGEKFESASGLSSAIDGVKNRFSAMEIIGTTALVNLTNSAMNFGKQMAKSLTIDQVKAGFSEYELKMGSIQTIMASTGKDIGTVNRYLNELNTYSDKTIYSFSDMTSSIGKFTNAGVDLDTAVKAIQGISNEAAVSGANAQEASRAMYNFSQALSAGYVKLIDWKSIENANMATKEFKQQLIDTAVAEGTLEKAADGTYKVLTSGAGGGFKETITATKNFNDSLSAAWMTSDVLTKTLGKYSDETTDIGKKAFAAAQDVKTFSQLLDTVKEAIGSGWAQTFELIFGNLEEAKKLWTGVNNVVSSFISKSADARNSAFEMWKVSINGRDRFLKGLSQMVKGVGNLVKPISEAFREVFPNNLGNKLIAFSVKLETFSKSFSKTMTSLGDHLKKPFQDVFKAGKDVIDLFSDAIAGLFAIVTGNGGESALYSAIVTFAEFIGMLARGVSAIIAFTRATGIFKALFNILNGLNTLLFGVFDSLYSIGDGLSGVFSSLAGPISSVSTALNNIFSGLSGTGAKALGFLSTALGKLISLIGTGLSKLDFSKIGGLLAGGGILAAGVKISKFVGTLSDKLDGLFGGDGDNDDGIMGKVKSTLTTLSDTLTKFQTSLKVGQLVAIAISLGILAAACSTLAKVPAKNLAAAVTAIGGLFWELAWATRYMKDAQTKGIIAMSVAVAILAKAVRQMSEIESMGKGLLGVGAILSEMTAFCIMFDRLKIKPKALAKTGAGLILMAYAIRMLAKPVKELGAMDIGSLVKGLVAVGVMLGEFTLTALAFSHIDTKGLLKSGVAMVIMASAMRLLAKPLTQLGGMDLKSLAKGLSAMGIALAELAGFTFVMGKIAASTGNILKVSAALLVMSIGISIMAGAINQMGMNADAGKGLSVLFGALVILAGAMALMQKSLAGAAAMIVVAGALMIMAPAIAVLSSLNLGGVVVGLLALAGTLVIFGAAAAILGPLTLAMAALGGAMALLGIGVLSLGAGLTMLVTAFSMATGVIIDGAKTIGETLPIIAEGVGNAIVTIVKTIGDSAGAFKDTFFALLDAILAVIYDATPDIVKAGMHMLVSLLKGIEANIKQITTLAISIITKFINALADGIPDLIAAGYNLIIKFLNSMADAISENGDRVANALANVLLSALGAVVGLIPGFGKKAKAAIDEYRKGLEDKSTKGKLDKSAKKVASDTEKNVKVKSQYDNGKNVVQGLKNGIDDMIPKLKTSASTVGDLVDKIIRKRNEVKSPSRRLYRTGSYLMQGLISGVDSMTGKYQARAENISTALVSSANRSVKEVSDIMAAGFGSNFGLSNSIDRAVTVSMSMDGIKNQNAELASKLNRLTNSLDGMTETMNSRALNNYITVDGTANPEAFADDLIRSFRLNARTV